MVSDREHSIHNNVMTAQLEPERLDLDEMTASFMDFGKVKYNPHGPKRFPGAVLKIDGTAFLVFYNTNIVLTGKTSERQKRKALRKFVDALNSKILGADYKIKRGSVKIENIVSEVDVGGYLDLDSMVGNLPFKTVYDPQMFPALSWKTPDFQAQVFGSGKVTVLGVKKKESLAEIQDRIKDELKAFIFPGTEREEADDGD
jgi:TATA-box binding protein (TBP) (component of TFIID and TFIIIB)